MARELGNKLGKWNKERAAAGKPSADPGGRDLENALEIQSAYFTHMDEIYTCSMHDIDV